MSCAAPGIPHPVLNSDSGASYPPYSHRVLQATGWSGAPVGVLFWSQHPEALSTHQGRSLRIPLSGSESACVCALSLRPVFGTLWDARDCSPPVSSVYGDSPGKNTGVGGHALLQRIFLTQESNAGLLQCRQTPEPLSHQGSPYPSIHKDKKKIFFASTFFI